MSKARTLEAGAIITASDRTGAAFASVSRKLAGLDRSARSVSRSMMLHDRAARSATAGMVAIGRVLGPAALAYGTTRAVRSFAELERRMTRVGITADASREDMQQFTGEARRMAGELAMPMDQIVAGADALAAQGRSMQEIRALLPSVAKTAQAAGAEVDDIARSADAVGTHLKIGATEMQKAFDIMAEGGKAGQFELKDMARYLPSLAPAAKALGMEGTKGLSDLVAMLQILRKGAGSAEEAATSMNNVLQKMSSEETRKRFAKMGVNLEAALKKGRKEGRNLIEVFEDATWKAIKGDLSQLPKVINDMEFARGMRALLSMRGEWQKLAGTIGQASGTVDRDLNMVLGDTEAKLQTLSNSWDRFVNAVGSGAVSLGAGSLLKGMAESIEELGDGLDRLHRIMEKRRQIAAADTEASGDAHGTKKWVEEETKKAAAIDAWIFGKTGIDFSRGLGGLVESYEKSLSVDAALREGRRSAETRSDKAREDMLDELLYGRSSLGDKRLAAFDSAMGEEENRRIYDLQRDLDRLQSQWMAQRGMSLGVWQPFGASVQGKGVKGAKAIGAGPGMDGLSGASAIEGPGFGAFGAKVGVPLIGDGGAIKAELEGHARVVNEIELTLNTDLFRAQVRQVIREEVGHIRVSPQMSPVGPGSTGLSSPDAGG